MKMGLSAREYLQQLQNINVSIDQDRSRLEAMRINATGQGAIRYDRDKVQASPQNRLCNDVCDIVTFDDRLNNRIDRFIDAREKIIAQIRGLHNATYNQVLFKVYVEYKSLRQTAIEMGRCYAFIRDRHKSALAEFEVTYPDLKYLV
jgi:hypothetical protein